MDRRLASPGVTRHGHPRRAGAVAKHPSGSMNGVRASVVATSRVSHRSQSFFLCAQMGRSEHTSQERRRQVGAGRDASEPSTKRTWLSEVEAAATHPA